MPTLINTQLKKHRGRSRLWLEGYKLLREGITPESRFDLEEIEPKKFRGVVGDAGRFRVSSRKSRVDSSIRLPLIDLNSELLESAFSEGERIRVTLVNGVMIISVCAPDSSIERRNARLIDKIKAGETLETASLFHGGGVLDKAIHAGFKKAGIDSVCRVAVERDERYINSSISNNKELWDSDSIIINAPIETVSPRSNSGEVDLLIAGLPCTGASKSGRSKNKISAAEEHKEAGGMFYFFLEFVRSLNPSMIIIENVVEYKNTLSMTVIRSVLDALGYDLQESVFCGNEFGALEKRKRFCMVAISKGLNCNFSLSDVKASRKKETCLGDILETIPPESSRWKPFTYLAEKEVRDKKAGKGFARQLLTAKSESIGTIGKGYAKCRGTEGFIVSEFDPNLSRLVTPLEHARVKTVPYSVVNNLSDTVAHQVLGQGVIYVVFEDISASLGENLKLAA